DVVAVDPLYRFGYATVHDRARRDFEAGLDFDPDRGRHLRSEMRTGRSRQTERTDPRDRFLADYRAGFAAGRYRAHSLPRLEFEDSSFDHVLCGHLLFLHDRHLGV